MLTRLGNVFYWSGCGFALICGGLAVAMFSTSGERALVPIAATLAVGVVVWLAGRAIRYVLSGI